MLGVKEDVNEEAFTKKLMGLFDVNSASASKKPWDRAKVKEVIQELTVLKYLGSAKKTSKQYYLNRTYQLVEIDGVEQIIYKPKTPNDPKVVLVPLEDYYKTLIEIHRSVGHGGRDKMTNALRQRCHIPRSVVELFISCCNTCNVKRTCRKFVLRPLTSTDFNIRARVDIIDLSETPDNTYKYLLSYHDHFTRFCNLRPLVSKEVPEVAHELLKIFLEFGTPRVLQSEDRKFATSLVLNLSNLWTECKVVHGNLERTTVSRKTIEDIEQQVKTWMLDNSSPHWSLGCYHVQWQRNNTINSEIGGRTPYKALFGRDSTTGLSSLTCPDDFDEDSFNKITTEEELEGILENKDEKRIVVMKKDNLHQTRSQVNIDEEEVYSQDSVSSSMVCCECNLESLDSDHTCSKCQKFMHLTCGKVRYEFGTSAVLCSLCLNEGKTVTELTKFNWVTQ